MCSLDWTQGLTYRRQMLYCWTIILEFTLLVIWFLSNNNCFIGLKCRGYREYSGEGLVLQVADLPRILDTPNGFLTHDSMIPECRTWSKLCALLGLALKKCICFFGQRYCAKVKAFALQILSLVCLILASHTYIHFPEYSQELVLSTEKEVVLSTASYDLIFPLLQKEKRIISSCVWKNFCSPVIYSWNIF